jgi:hypothetical protein
MRLVRLSVLVLTQAFAPQVFAADTDMIRVLLCQGEATIELYVPQSIVAGQGPNNVDLKRPVEGYYALDLTEFGKGKPLEKVRVSLAQDKTAVIVDQFNRRLPPVRIPFAGGTVSFDNRFGANAKCNAFNTEAEN